MKSFTRSRLLGCCVEDPAAGGGGGGGTPVFAETLPEDIRGDVSFKDMKDVGSLAKAYLNANRMIGLPADRRMALPAGDDPKEWNDVWAKLGRPESADKYTVPKRGDKDYSPEEQAFQKSIMPVLHEAGLTQRQVAAIVPKWNAMIDAAAAASEKQSTTAREAANSKLKSELGAAYTEKMELAKQAINHYAQELKLDDDVVKELNATGLGNSPALAKLFIHLGGQLKEDGVLGKGGSSGGALSPAEAEQAIGAKQRDPAFMKVYQDKTHPDHKSAVEEMQRLYEAKAAKAA